AERRQTIRPKDVVERITAIGKFFAECVARHQEWFISILPLQDRAIDERTRKELAEEFYAGVSAQYNHILADLDAPRPGRILEIAEGFDRANVVIVRGASGQGKTTLALRYLHEFFPALWRFHIPAVVDRHHAFRVAAALVGHADAVG